MDSFCRSVWKLLICCETLALIFLVEVRGHGRMVEPPGRNTMWRLDFPTPENYDDTELFCGGLKVTFLENGGKCGICGDNYAMKQPRPHESGGDYSTGMISRIYQPGRVLDALIDIVANHRGWFEFSICERNNPEELETEECFDRRKLELADGTGTKFFIPRDDNGFYVIPIKIPRNISCTHCILRWHWKAANNWGKCEDGSKAVGCGPQEIYRNCADVAILPGAGIRGSFNGNPKRRRFPVALKLHPFDEK